MTDNSRASTLTRVQKRKRAIRKKKALNRLGFQFLSPPSYRTAPLTEGRLLCAHNKPSHSCAICPVMLTIADIALSRGSALTNEHEWRPERGMCLEVLSRSDHRHHREAQRLGSSDFRIRLQLRHGFRNQLDRRV
jgi:hypothetical protein